MILKVALMTSFPVPMMNRFQAVNIAAVKNKESFIRKKTWSLYKSQQKRKVDCWIQLRIVSLIWKKVKVPSKKKKSRGISKPKEGEDSRKKTRNPGRWDKNITKWMKTKGKEYHTLKEKKIARKKLKEPCGSRMKCFEKFTHAETFIIFHQKLRISLLRIVYKNIIKKSWKNKTR